MIYKHAESKLKVCQKIYKDAKAELQNEQELFVAGVQQEIDSRKLQTRERKNELKQAQENELNGRGADTTTIRKYDDRLAEIRKELDYIHEYRPQVLYYERDKAVIQEIQLVKGFLFGKRTLFRTLGNQ